jgi:LysM repeat protein
MKKTLFAILVVLLSILCMADTPQRSYIEKYSALAIEEMYRTGVPASITLAQGLLESGNGLSELAVKGNNHFGIKCHNTWTGAKVYHDDDAKGECFRKYDSPEESFRDHSDFLRYRDRYKFLFDYELTDYKSWAYGLKAAGYATDPKYPEKLIRLIEEYELYLYDSMQPVEAEAEGEGEGEVRQQIPESPVELERARPLTDSQREVFRFALSRQMYSQNGVPFVYAEEGETYESIAKSYRLFHKEILKFNDLKEDAELLPGTVVYLQKKMKTSHPGLDRYVVEEGQTLWEISQRFAVRMKSICRLNGISEDHVLREGDVLQLR